jgi:TrmH family RNA methyltransferase
MGSIARVSVAIQHLPDLFANHSHLPVYGALLKGENIYQQQWQKGGFILMGSESQGISTNLIPFISSPITIPAFGGAESLNVAVATAVICSEYKRYQFNS